MGEGAVGRAPVDNDRQGVHAIPYGATSWGTHHTATTTEPIQNPPTHHASTTAVFRHGMARFTGGHARCRAEHLAYSGEPLSRTNKDRGDPCGRFYPGFKEARHGAECVL